MKYYDSLAGGYDKLYSSEQESKFFLLKDWLGSLRGLTLDLGAGTGLLNKYLDLFVSADSSFEMLKLNSADRRVCCDASFLPFKDRSFDNIVCFTMLQDIQAKRKVLAEVKRVCKHKVILTLIKRGKSLTTVKSWFNDFKIIEFREQQKDYCFLLLAND